MNLWTAIIALSGIGGTLLAPLIAGRVARRSAIFSERIAAYRDTLIVVGHLHSNADVWATMPLMDLKEPSSDLLRESFARVRVVGSDEVYGATKAIADLNAEFSTGLMKARIRESGDRTRGEGDSPQAIHDRVEVLSQLAKRIGLAIDALETAIRAEMDP